MSSSSNMADGYTKHELRAISRHNRRVNRSSYNKKTRSYKFANFVVNFWWLILLIIGIIAVVCIYLYMSASLYMESLVQQYDAVNEKVTNSKDNFTKTLFYASVDEDGKLVFAEKGKDIDEVDEDNEVEEDASDSWDGEGLAFEAMDMYKHAKFNAKGDAVNCQPLASYNISLYNSIPWEDDGNWYKLDTDAVSRYLEKNLGAGLKDNSDAFHTDDNIDDTMIPANGINCLPIAWYPIFAFTDISETGQIPSDWIPYQEYGNQYGCVQLSKGSQTYYLPIIDSDDRKGHTFPGGLVQTYIHGTSKYNPSSGKVKLSNGGETEITWDGTQFSIGGVNEIIMPMSQFISEWNTKVKYLGVPITAHPMLSLEIRSELVSALGGKGLKIEAFFIHKGDKEE